MRRPSPRGLVVALPVLFLATAALAQPRSPTLRGRIAYADTGLPVRHASVTLLKSELQWERPSAITDRSGEFAVKDVPPGDYIVDVDAPDLIRLERLEAIEMATEMTQRTAPHDSPAALERRRKERQQLIDRYLPKIHFTGREESPVEVRVQRGGMISGKVSFADGSPAANLNIELFGKQGDVYSPVLVEPMHAGFDLQRVQTDDQGRYRILGLLPGEYYLSATEPSANKSDEFSSDEVQSLLATYYPSATELGQARAIQVQLARETTGVDVVVHERRLRTVSGTLKTRLGHKPVAGARILLSRKDDAAKPFAIDRHLYGESDRDGRWAFHEVPDGQYVIQFSPDLGANEAWSSGDAHRPQNFVESTREITVSGDAPAELPVEVLTGGRLSGKVVVEGERKLPSVSLSLRDAHGELLHGQYFSTRPDFSFAVSGVLSDDLEIMAPVQGYRIRSITLHGAALPRPFEVADGDDVTGIEIVLAPE